MLGALSALPDALCVNGDVCLDSSSYWTVSLLLGALLLMANEAAPDLTMLGFTVLLVLSEVISDAEAWAGFSSTSVLSIGALFVVARALEETRESERRRAQSREAIRRPTADYFRASPSRRPSHKPRTSQCYSSAIV